MTSSALESVVEAQLTSLDDTDCYASAWEDALASAVAASGGSAKLTQIWGGRGKGGRGLARRTVQPFDVVVEDVSLEYVGGDGGTSKSGRMLLENATLKLLSRRVYALTGRNGCGKSTLLRRIHAKKVPGFPPHLSTLYIPQEVTFASSSEEEEGAALTPIDIVVRQHRAIVKQSAEANLKRIEDLEAELEALDMESEDDQGRVESLCEQISALEEKQEEESSPEDGSSSEDPRVAEALSFFGVDERMRSVPMQQLSGGQQKKVMLSSALYCNPDILMLDEPTNFLDCHGILQLRQLILSCEERNITVVLVSHDIDLINDVATDVIHFANRTLAYYPGNYSDFKKYKHQGDVHQLRQSNALEKQRKAMLTTIDNIKKQSSGRRGDSKKTARAVESRKKKLERHGLEKDDHGHRWTAQSHGGIRPGSINSVDASKRKNLSHAQLLKQAETNVAPVPDKAVQFMFRDPTSSWGEPLIMAMDVGHGFGCEVGNAVGDNDAQLNADVVVKRDGMLFDCVDLCIDEGSRTCILGANGSGKSTLLKVLAGSIQPLEGKVHFANNVNVCYFHQHIADDIIRQSFEGPASVVTPLSLMSNMFPKKTEQDLRGELTAFGLSPKQAATNVKFLSGGERCRLCLAVLFLKDPHVLLMDEPSCHLDPESVEALAYGIKQWKGTLVMVSHDANLIRGLGGTCYVLMEKEAKLRRINDGIDTYLRAFGSTNQVYLH